MTGYGIVLAPGFFGFDQLGKLEYWNNFAEAMSRHINARFLEVRTPPTASIKDRATAVGEAAELAYSDCYEVIIIGHSTGGLDARYLVSPSTDIDCPEVSAVITVSTPHHGTRAASLAASIGGQKILDLMADAPQFWIRHAWRLIRSFEKLLPENLILDYLADIFSPDLDQDRLQRWLHELSENGALLQLTPDCLHLLNDLVDDDSGINYYSYITAGPWPSRPSIYAVIHRLVREFPDEYELPELEISCRNLLGYEPTSEDNDGVVPVLSQNWGQIAGIMRGDHLDSCGHIGILQSDSHFSEVDFEDMVQDMAARIKGDTPPTPRGNNFLSVVER